MKKILPLVAMLAFFAACNGKQNTSTMAISQADTSGLKEFQDAKARQEVIQTQPVYNTNSVTDNTPKSNTASTVVTEEKTTTTTAAPEHSTYHAAHHHHYHSGRYDDRYAASEREAPARKRGWSHAAKDAAIGAGSGAVAGALISKDHSKGAIIGGVLGAGGGYLLGRSKDKKTGRH